MITFIYWPQHADFWPGITLTESQVTSKGVIITNYKRAGEVVTGDVGP